MMGKFMGRSNIRRRAFLGSSLATAALTLSSSVLLQANGIVAHHTPAFTTHKAPLEPVKPYSRPTTRMFSQDIDGMETFSDVLPVEKGSHNSAKVSVPVFDLDNGDNFFDKATFRDKLGATVTACRELGRSSLWVEVPMSRAGLIEDMAEFGLRFHHARDDTAVLNVWLKDEHESKIPEFATHNVGVGAVVVNSRNEILCVRELRKNYMPWKTPTGLSELGEQIDEAAVREVLEETGIHTKFHSIVGFRQTHGLSHGRSDLFFVCQLDPIEETDANGNIIIPNPVPQANEIEKAEWVPLSEYRAMVKGEDGGGGHPMMSHVIDVLEGGRNIDRTLSQSLVAGRKSNYVYYPSAVLDKTP
jgi:ADP-ribose pyrophosphatase YjhB (NUDIX family)